MLGNIWEIVRSRLTLDNSLAFSILVLVYYWILNSKEDENLFLKHVFRKVFIILDSVLFMILSKDTKGLGPKKNRDPELIKDKAKLHKTLIFIRHGESDWNDVFNKGINPSMLVRFYKAMVLEFKYFTSLNSSFIDSPLNFDGIEQAISLSKYINSLDASQGQPEHIVDLITTLRGSQDLRYSSVIVSSQLRRAVATTTLSMWPRLSRTGEKIHILSSLQEISRNVDTYALSPAHAIADLPFERIAPHCPGFNSDSAFDLTGNFGNKAYGFYGIKRLKAFCDWVFTRNENTIIVGGHSLWFKHFFQTYLPHHSHHESKSKKITNSGVIAFKLYSFEEDDGITYYRIEPESITTVYGGFTTK